MTALPAGVVLPADILVQPWFAVFSLFVAFNTIIYLGLTAAKFVPWPAQVRPRQVRRYFSHDTEETQMGNTRRTAARNLEAPERDVRAATARQTIPIALALVGALTAAVGLLYLMLYFPDEGVIMIVGPVFGFILVGLSLVLSRARLSAMALSWIWSLLMLGFIVETSWRSTVLDSAVPLAYTLVALGFIAPIGLSWRTGITVAVLGIAPIIIAGSIVSVVDTLSWALSAVSAALSSLVMLYLRVVALDSATEARALAASLATNDPLTGTFSRAGMLVLAPTLAEAAERTDDPVGVALCHIDDIAGTNADYGFAYGDQVIATTARAFRAALPERALLARWGGESFLAVMTGAMPEEAELLRQIDDNLASSGVALGKRRVRVTVGVASGLPRTTTLESLVAEAEPAAMPQD